MSENSLFAVLLRSPWWISVAIAAALGVGATALFPKDMRALGPFVGLPFAVIGMVAAWRQWRAPSAARIAATARAAAAMSWRDFAIALQAALERDGYVVEKCGGAADFAAQKGGRTTLVAARRWKAASLGIETLRELEAERVRREAYEVMVVVAGEISENARRYAHDHAMLLAAGAELVRLLPDLADAGKARA
ncbi:MAG: restriction endonuclease [Burkholderiales bacterium]|nr:restriction endonuclease [Burkholderiales bacterium]